MEVEVEVEEEDWGMWLVGFDVVDAGRVGLVTKDE
jgi:hypothetical protein